MERTRPTRRKWEVFQGGIKYKTKNRGRKNWVVEEKITRMSRVENMCIEIENENLNKGMKMVE